MEQYISKSDLVAEIERRLWLLVPKMTFYQQRVELEKLLSFIDTLEVKEVEEEHVSEELEEAAKKYGNKKHPMTTIGANESAQDFKAGAKWGKNQAKVEIQAQSMALAHGCPRLQAQKGE